MSEACPTCGHTKKKPTKYETYKIATQHGKVYEVEAKLTETYAYIKNSAAPFYKQRVAVAHFRKYVIETEADELRVKRDALKIDLEDIRQNIQYTVDDIKHMQDEIEREQR